MKTCICFHCTVQNISSRMLPIILFARNNLWLWRQFSLFTRTSKSRYKKITLPSIYFLLLILFPLNIIAHLKLFQPWCTVETRDALNISFRGHFAWLTTTDTTEWLKLEAALEVAQSNPLHQLQPPAVGCSQLYPVELMDLSKKTSPAEIIPTQN